ncbi:LTA synthase family protein [Haloarcula sp. Atlit-7R]|uniref:LTA synthase family protein n=1 Tax=Haloarcula sp. Atlit-7R TaxID=2282125 RepID=UPI0011C421C0|nr:LTA synthase family protein [Haloarcula sp. Atlit-7R]
MDVLPIWNRTKRRIRQEIIGRWASRNYSPTPVWEEDWDLLIILDGCRADLMWEVEDEYDFLNDRGQLTSVGSTTIEWLENTIQNAPSSEIEQTAYITGNPNSVVAFRFSFPNNCSCGKELDPAYDDVYHSGTTTCSACGEAHEGDRIIPTDHLDEVWRSQWNNELGTILPRPITDAAIRYGRTNDFDRLIVHYMQPHHPFISIPDVDRGTYIEAGDEDRVQRTETIWEQLQSGELTEDFVWHHYAENLRCVLNDVALLLDNIDADSAVITSDHGNAIGEYGVYGHLANVPLPCLVDVPWYRTTANDAGDYDPGSSREDRENLTSNDVKDRLADLGYM